MTPPYSAARALRQYQQTEARGSVATASPHRLILMLLDRALREVESARAHMERAEVGPSGECISRAIDVLGGLRGSLDYERGGEIAEHLRDLYGYACRVLLTANLGQDPAKLDEVLDLLGEVKSGWESIPPELRGETTQ